MKHKLLTILLTLAATLCLCLGLVGCDNSGDGKKANSSTTDNGGNIDENEDDLWTVERLYAEAQAKGFEGSLDDLIALFKGDTGEQGPKGETGKDGIGIKSVEVDENGHLKVTLTDGTVLDAGKVTGDTPAQEGTEGLQYQKIKGENGEYTAVVVGLGTAWDTDIVIPSTFRGLTVTAIGNSAFDASKDARNANLTSVEIPDSVTSIGSSAFYNCSGLTSVEISDAVTSIGSSAFYSSGLTTIKIPDGVTSIEEQAFYNCNSLESVTFGNKRNLTSIGERAFRLCSSLTSITIPDGVTSIGYRAFHFCRSLESVTIPDSVTEIEPDAFSLCDSLISIEVAPNNPVYHSSGNCLIWTESKILIQGCKTSMIPNDGSVTEIGSSAFYGCGGLTSIIIPDSVTSIGYDAFNGCIGLTSIVISSSVTRIDNSAFYGCNSLTSIQFKGTVNEWNSIQKYAVWGDLGAGDYDYTITCTDGTIDKQGNVSYFEE